MVWNMDILFWFGNSTGYTSLTPQLAPSCRCGTLAMGLLAGISWQPLKISGAEDLPGDENITEGAELSSGGEDP